MTKEEVAIKIVQRDLAIADMNSLTMVLVGIGLAMLSVSLVVISTLI